MGTGTSVDHATEPALCLVVDEWRTDKPSIYVIDEDGIASDSSFEDCLNPATRLLEFRVKLPSDYPGGRARFLGVTHNLLCNKATLGVHTLYLDKNAQEYVKALNKSKHGRVTWSNTISIFGCQVSWTEDRSDSSMTNFRFQIDEEESAVAIVDRENSTFCNELNSDKQKFVDAFVLPLRILLRVTWWKDLFGSTGINLPVETLGAQASEQSGSTKPGEDWWWPLVLEAQQKAKAKEAAAASASATNVSAATDDDSHEPAEPVVKKKKPKKNKGQKRKANHRNRERKPAQSPYMDAQETQPAPESPSSPASHASASELFLSSDTLCSKTEDQAEAVVSGSLSTIHSETPRNAPAAEPSLSPVSPLRLDSSSTGLDSTRDSLSDNNTLTHNENEISQSLSTTRSSSGEDRTLSANTGSASDLLFASTSLDSTARDSTSLTSTPLVSTPVVSTPLASTPPGTASRGSTARGTTRGATSRGTTTPRDTTTRVTVASRGSTPTRGSTPRGSTNTRGLTARGTTSGGSPTRDSTPTASTSRGTTTPPRGSTARGTTSRVTTTSRGSTTRDSIPTASSSLASTPLKSIPSDSTPSSSTRNSLARDLTSLVPIPRVPTARDSTPPVSTSSASSPLASTARSTTPRDSTLPVSTSFTSTTLASTPLASIPSDSTPSDSTHNSLARDSTSLVPIPRAPAARGSTSLVPIPRTSTLLQRNSGQPGDQTLKTGMSPEIDPSTGSRSESRSRSELPTVNTNLPSDLSSAPGQLSQTNTSAQEEKKDVGTAEHQRQRADAITLIRARTLSRLSPIEGPALTTSSTQQSQQDLSQRKELSDADPTSSVKDTATMAKKKHSKKKKKKQQQRSDQQQTTLVGEQPTQRHFGSFSQNFAPLNPMQVQAETRLPTQMSSRTTIAASATQVPISNFPLLQTDSSTLQSPYGTHAKDSKSSLDPLAVEYVPNYQSGDNPVSPAKESQTSVYDTSARLGDDSLTHSPTDTKKEGAGRFGSKSTHQGSPAKASAAKSRHTADSPTHSNQPHSTGDVLSRSLPSSPDDRRSTLPASSKRPTASQSGKSALSTGTSQAKQTVSGSGLEQTEQPADEKISQDRSTSSTGLQSVRSPQASGPIDENRRVSSQHSSITTDDRQLRHASSISVRSRLSPIREAVIERTRDEHRLPSRQGHTSIAGHSHPDPPDTTSSESIASGVQNLSIQQTQDNSNTGQSELTTTEAESQDTIPSASSHLVGSHAHPAPPSTLTVQPSRIGQGGPTIHRPAGFFWQLDSHGFPCAKADCDKRCNSWDGVSAICPRCGPYSEVRYCTQEHLYEDIKPHWAFCGQMTFRHPCRESTIPRRHKEGPPLLPSRHNWDTPERHRQAVYHATNSGGDYFIFADWAEFMAAGQPANNVGVRCTSRVLAIVKFDEPGEKDRFRRVLGACLLASIEVFNLVDYMFRLIRDNLRSRGLWSGELDNALRYQMQLELSVTVNPGAVGQRHACETEWDGRNRRHCADSVCRTEYRPLLGDQGMGRGFDRLCDYMESSHWLLRAARRTHPTVAQVAARTRGEGFEDVVDEDRRLFRRGEGWDGAGTGEMEIEGVNV